jgi:hypothetical protein
MAEPVRAQELIPPSPATDASTIAALTAPRCHWSER